MGKRGGHFPTLYPGEIVYSVFARYCKRLRLQIPRIATQRLFGHSCSVPVELPSRLDVLVNNLPEGHSYTSDLLIDRHTTFPYYSFFINEKRRGLIRDAMRRAGGAGIRAQLGVAAGRTKPLLFLRHCPACDIENRRVYGETYWHRLHQITGVEVCPKHRVFLEETDVTRGTICRRMFVDAETACPPVRPKVLDSADSAHSMLLAIAIDVDWILNRTTDVPRLAAIYEAYDFKLAQIGLASYTGVIKWELLSAKIIERYPAYILHRLNCELGDQHDRRRRWPTKLLCEPRSTQSPIRHLLLINFFGMSISAFTTSLLDEQLHPTSLFGPKPWNCLNSVCKHYCNETIQTCVVENDPRIKDRVIGRFQCVHCGFTYNRFGPDPKRHNRLGKGWVTEYGPLWHARLRDGWMDERVNLTVLAKNLGVTICVVKRQATRWNLMLPKPGQVVRKGSEKSRRWRGRYKVIDQETISKMRSHWLCIRENEDGKNIKDLVKLYKDLYHYLRRHDLSWLSKHPPRRKKRIASGYTVNWSDRESTLITKIAPAATAVMSRSGEPIIVNRVAICRQAGISVGLYNRRSKMPKFAAALNEAAETKLAFALRRISWAVEEIKRQGSPVGKTELIRLAGANVRRLLSNPVVEEAVTNGCRK